MEGAGSENSCLSTWVQPLTFHPPVSAECSSARALCLATFPPTMACREAPSLRVSFRYVLGPRPCAAFTPGQGPGQAGGREREREVSSSSVCHGLNTVASCWFKPPSLPIPLAYPFQKPRRGAEKAGGAGTPARAVSFLPEFVFFTSFALTTQPAPGREAVGLLPRPVQSYLLTKGLFFFFKQKQVNCSLSVLLLLSCHCFTLACPNYKP